MARMVSISNFRLILWRNIISGCVMKRLRVTFTVDRVYFDIITNGQIDRIQDMYRQPDTLFLDIADQMAKKHKIEDIEYITKS